MSFKTLEQRYRQTVNDLYKGSETKFKGGKPTTNRTDDPLRTVRIGNGYWNAAESRSTPIFSAAEDTKRITLFTLGSRGIQFLVKQQVLQTGNTFEQTRLINPLFAIANAIPFLHVKRSLRPIGPTSKDYKNVRTLGQLQSTTYDSITSGGGIGKFARGVFKSFLPTVSAVTAKRNVRDKGWYKSRPELGENDGEYFLSKLLGAPIDTSPLPLFSIFNSANVGYFKHVGKTVTEYFIGQRYGAINNKDKWDGTYSTYLRDSNQLTMWMGHKDISLPSAQNERASFLSSETSSLVVKWDEYGKNFELQQQERKYFNKELTDHFYELPTDYRAIDYIRYFDNGIGTVNSYKKFDNGIVSQNAKELAEANKDKYGRISYIIDPLNIEQKQNDSAKLDNPYKKLPSIDTKVSYTEEDPVVVSIAMANKNAVQFRAFIRDLQHNVTPEYKKYQYIGRIEKFINYLGVQREISFKLGIIAFSELEINVVWDKLNYLTGLAFPYGYSNGIMQPNVMKLTIGEIFRDQPGYVTSLNFTFDQLSKSWDINRGLPVSAEVDIRMILIEKSSRIASSPFYGTKEKDSKFNEVLPPGAVGMGVGGTGNGGTGGVGSEGAGTSGTGAGSVGTSDAGTQAATPGTTQGSSNPTTTNAEQGTATKVETPPARKPAPRQQSRPKRSPPRQTPPRPAVPTTSGVTTGPIGRPGVGIGGIAPARTVSPESGFNLQRPVPGPGPAAPPPGGSTRETPVDFPESDRPRAIEVPILGNRRGARTPPTQRN